MKYLGKIFIFFFFISLATSLFAQQLSHFPSSFNDSTCTGDTAFISINIVNIDNVNPLKIDSIQIPNGFVRKQIYPVTIPPADTTLLEFYNPATTVGISGDSLKIYSNAANVPSPYRIFARLKINPKPAAGFSVTDSAQCFEVNSFQFTNTTTISAGTVTYEWFLGDFSQDFSTSPTKTYTAADTFTVTLIAKSDRNCNAFLSKKVIVFPTPVAKIQNTNTFTCFKNHKINFVDSSKISSGTYTVKWFFGTGDSSAKNDTSYVYPKDSTYKIKLFATSNRGCAAVDSQSVTINPSPNVAFTVNDSAQCINGNNYNFTNGSTIRNGSIVSYDWNFGDGNTSSNTSPTNKVYSTVGIKTVRLIALSDINCADTLSKQISVLRKPTPAFTTNDSTQCLVNNLFSFTNGSTIGGTDTNSYFWSFGDGITKTADTNTTHTYAANGSYTVKLLVTSNKGCKDSVTHTTTTFVHPQAAFATNDTAQCLNAQNFAFTNGSSISSGTIDGYSWRFGNGDTSDILSPTKNNYLTHDTVSVLLIARSNQNCYDTARQTVIIFPVPQLQFSITDTALCFNNNVFQFNDNSTIDYGTLNYQWQFGDGSTSAAADTVYTYNNYATLYQIGFKVSSDQGCNATGTDSVYLYQNPEADFIILDSAKCLRANSFTFLDNSTIPSGTFTPFWEFGNSDTSSQPNPTYSYNFSDTFTVKLTVTSDLGCVDSLKKQTIVFPHPATNYIVKTPIEQCFKGHQFIFKDTTANKAPSYTYNWDFGDGTSAFDTLETKMYLTADTFNITYTVTSNQGCDSTITGNVYVNPSPANVGFTTNDTTQCINSNLFNYTNTTTLSNGTMFYTWFLGNGSTSNSRDASLVYLTTDTLTVKMRITTDKNCTDSASQNIYIYPNPTVSFNVNDATQCFGGNNFTLTNVSNIKYGTLSYSWDLDDGTSSTQTSLTHSFATADTFNIKLKATSDLGCADSITRNIFVFPDPIADFVINDDAQCINNNSFQFTDNTFIQSGTINYSWNFGDNTGASNNSPSHIYLKADTFSVTLITTSNLGCKDTIAKDVYVTPSPDPSFAGLSKQFCINGPTVTLTPKVPGGTFSGDNITGNQFSPVQPGWNYVRYDVSLNGCSDSLIDSTQIVPVPIVDLGLDTVLCKEDFYSLNVFTQGATYFWSDSSTSSYFKLTDPGIHWVRVTNACGTFTDSVVAEYLDFACDAFMPNAFTPEGNTVNDYFVPYIDTNVVKGIQIIIFSRWGDIVFETTDVKTLGWDGNFNGKPAPEGVYGYLVNLKLLREDTRVLKQLKGSLHLLR